jgi:A/G-specific adenine glycosylase
MHSRARLTALRRRLLGWYRRNQRKLPWRRPGPDRDDPYRIWLSEVMLQQTRVAVARPYYRRFLRRFPTFSALARAHPEEVLKLWAGLGYYARARSLHRAAQQIVTRHRGRFPRSLEEALALPGIGRYTAAAVLSIAYRQPYAVLDGNVARVLARLSALRGDLRASKRWKKLQKLAQRLLAPHTPGDWNQAIMELGATLCTPRAPRCGLCPVSRWCRAYALSLTHDLPETPPRRKPVQMRIAAAVLLDRRGRTLVVKQADGAVFSQLWQFPAIEVNRNAQAELAHHLGSWLQPFVALPPARHSVTFREITLLPFLIRVDRLPAMAGACTPRLDQLDRLPASSATRKIAERALEAVRARIKKTSCRVGFQQAASRWPLSTDTSKFPCSC